MTKKYDIIRYRFKKPNKIIKQNVSLKEAQEHCSNPQTKGFNWFDGYKEH